MFVSAGRLTIRGAGRVRCKQPTRDEFTAYGQANIEMARSVFELSSAVPRHSSCRGHSQLSTEAARFHGGGLPSQGSGLSPRALLLFPGAPARARTPGLRSDRKELRPEIRSTDGAVFHEDEIGALSRVSRPRGDLRVGLHPSLRGRQSGLHFSVDRRPPRRPLLEGPCKIQNPFDIALDILAQAIREKVAAVLAKELLC